jgi:hypothetical protein
LLGAVAALGTLVSALADIATSITVKKADFEPGSLSPEEWFALLLDRPLLGLRNLGVLNALNSALGVPLAGALLTVHWRSNRAVALVAAGIQVAGAIVYIAGNRALTMFKLSRRYASAASDADRDAIILAADAGLARGEDFTPATFPGLFLTSLAPTTMGLAMLRGGSVPKYMAWLGIVGPFAILLYTTWATFVRAAFRPALLFAAIGGLATMAWYGLNARHLLRLARASTGVDRWRR